MVGAAPPDERAKLLRDCGADLIEVLRDGYDTKFFR